MFTRKVPVDKLTEDVRAWLDKGGFVLEMRVARTLTEHGVMVTQGDHYRDPISGAEREVDLSGFMDVTIKDEHWHALDITVECKSTQAPWVGFLGQAGHNGPFTAGHYLDPGCALCMDMVRELGAFRQSTPRAYALKEKTRAGRDKDHAYEGLQQVVNASLSVYTEPAFNGHPDDKIISMLAMPILVTDGPLFSCSLDRDSSVALKRVDRLRVLVPRLQLPDPDTDGLEVMVVTFDGLPDFLGELSALTDAWHQKHQS